MSKDANEMANHVDPDQTAFLEQSDLGLNCLLKSVCPYIQNICDLLLLLSLSSNFIIRIKLCLSENIFYLTILLNQN